MLRGGELPQSYAAKHLKKGTLSRRGDPADWSKSSRRRAGIVKNIVKKREENISPLFSKECFFEKLPERLQEPCRKEPMPLLGEMYSVAAKGDVPGRCVGKADAKARGKLPAESGKGAGILYHL